MRFNRKSILLLVLLVAPSTCLTLYTIAAYNVARLVIEMNGVIYWPDSKGGSFFPWPTRPSGFGLQVLMPIVDKVDLRIYTYLIKSWILVGITALLWVGTFLYILKLAVRASHLPA